jgi:hypothetical protein
MIESKQNKSLVDGYQQKIGRKREDFIGFPFLPKDERRSLGLVPESNS